MTKEKETYKHLKEIAKGSSLIFSSRIIVQVLQLLYTIFLVRYLKPNEYGAFSLALVIVNIISLVALVGFEEGITRQTSFLNSTKEEKELAVIATSSFFFAAFFSTLFAISLFFFSERLVSIFYKDQTVGFALRILILTLPFMNLVKCFNAYLRGLEKVYSVFTLRTVSSVVKLLILIGAIVCQVSFSLILGLIVFSNILVFVFSYYLIKKNFSFNIVSATAVKNILKFSLPLLMSGMLGFLMSWTDTLLLGYYESTNAVAIYRVGFSLSRKVMFVFSSMTFMFFPVITRLIASREMKKVNSLYQSTTKWTFLLSFPLIFLFFVHADQIVPFLFKQQYISSAGILRIFLIGSFIHLATGPNGITAVSFGKTKVVFWATFSGAFINLPLNMIFIPAYGYHGAAWVSVVSLLLANMIIVGFNVKLFRVNPFNHTNLITLILASGVMGVGYVFFQQNFLFSFLLLGAFYVIILTIMPLQSEDKFILNRVLEKLKILLPNRKK